MEVGKLLSYKKDLQTLMFHVFDYWMESSSQFFLRRDYKGSIPCFQRGGSENVSYTLVWSKCSISAIPEILQPLNFRGNVSSCHYI